MLTGLQEVMMTKTEKAIKKEESEATEKEQTIEPENVEETEDEKEEVKEETIEDEDLNTKYLRLMADFQNYRRRSEEDRSKIHAFANEKIVSQLLDILDNFERALDHDADEGFKNGMEMIFNQLKDVLLKSGVKEIEANNEEFDPNFHNAVMMEDTDKVESGKISEVLQKGYTLNGKVIRAVMVKVAN